MSVGSAQLGGLLVSAQGLGCMSMSGFYGPAEEQESLATIRRALDLGVTLLDTSDRYGNGANEELIGRAIAGRRQQVVVATKFGMLQATTPGGRPVCGTPEYVRAACDASLRRLGTDYIDLFQQHRIDPEVPIEETVGALVDLIRDGKIRHYGLCEPSSESIRRAHAVHPVTTVQSEWSLWSRDVEAEVRPTCRELGIGLLAYAPLGRGFLTGRFRAVDDFEEGDARPTSQPRLSEGNLEKNLGLVRALEEVAARIGVSAGQCALAWLHAQGRDVVPIPGTKRRRYLEENLGALEVRLSADEGAAIEAAVPAAQVVGDRYPPERMRLLNADTRPVDAN